MASTRSAKRSTLGATSLLLLGLALAGLGGAFVYAPKFSWQLTKIAQQAAELGIQSGALIVGGLVIVGLGVVARVAGGAPAQSSSDEELEGLQAELHLLNEQLSTKLGQLRTALLQVQDGVSGVAAQQQELAALQAQSDATPAQDQSQDAVFRLAASLDKLHAHFDERVHAIDLQLRNGFETLLNVAHRGGAVNAVPAPLPSQMHGGHGGHGHAHGYGAPQPEGIDFYQTMEKLDAIAGSLDDPQDPGQPQPPFPSAGVDALDALLPEEYRDRY